jgi:hypothetical protein
MATLVLTACLSLTQTGIGKMARKVQRPSDLMAIGRSLS